MKVWTKCVWDASGELIEEECQEYDGPVAECKSKTTITTPPPTAQETALQQKQLELAGFQLEQLKLQSEHQAEFGTEFKSLFALQAEREQTAAAREAELQPIQDEFLQLALEDARRGGAASPEQIRLIDEAADAALARGEVDISRFETQGLESLREELAPSLGLRPTDTPILDRGGKLAAEALRQRGALSESLRGASATARLNFPLSVTQVQGGFNLGQQGLLEATRSFQANLQQQAFANRLGIADLTSGIGSRLVGNPAGTLSSALNPLTQSRLAQTTQRTSGFGLNQIGQLASGVGGLLTGIRGP